MKFVNSRFVPFGQDLKASPPSVERHGELELRNAYEIELLEPAEHSIIDLYYPDVHHDIPPLWRTFQNVLNNEDDISNFFKMKLKFF